MRTYQHIVPSLVKMLLTVAILSFLKPPTLLAWLNGQNASYVLGQSNFSSNGTADTQTGLKTQMFWTGGNTYDATHKWLFVPDAFNNRVLIYDFNATPLATTPAPVPATYVLGQPNFTSNASAFTQNGMFAPESVAFDATSQRLFVGEYGNYRILVFDLSSGVTNYMNAAYVLGQSTWTTATQYSPPKQWTINKPGGMFYDGSGSNQRLFVADTSNSRVLVFDFNVTPLASGSSATYVLGQSNFTSMVQTASQTGMNQDTGLTYDYGTNRLFVTDALNSRVLVYDFNVSPLATTPAPVPATYVLGQPNFTSNSGAATQSGLLFPANIALDPLRQQLFVADMSNNRTEIFNLWGGIVNGMNASYVLGQPNFTSNTPATNATNLRLPYGVTYDSADQWLFVTDTFNNRVMVFNSTNISLPMACSGPTMICGAVTAAEGGASLPGVPVSLRDAQGTLMATRKTDSSGNFSFSTSDGLTPSSTYYIVPTVGRTQSAVPFEYPIPNLQPAGAFASLQIRGMPANLQLSGATPGTSILISTASYAGSNSPTVSPSAGNAGFYTAMVTTAGTATVPVPAGYSYYVTCWLAQASGASVTYARDPANGSNGPYPVTTPNGQVAVACP